MRIAPLLGIIVLFVVLVSSLGQTLLWVVAAISVIALVVLIVVTARANRFTGPKVLVDDARERWDRFGREPEEVEVEVVEIEPKDPKNDQHS